MYVFVLGKNKQPLMPCHAARARILLKKGRAAVFRRFPFTIILKDRESGMTQPMRIKIDPGSKVSGIAITVKRQSGETVVIAANLQHRSEAIVKSMNHRRIIRRSRRNRKTRYREARFNNRVRQCGWLPPSIYSRIANIETWVRRIKIFTPIQYVSLENVKFDMQLMENPDIQGVEYQHGTLAGFELREYLLTQYKYNCMYCKGLSNDKKLNIEHFIPRNPLKGPRGSDKISNLGIACVKCNRLKSNLQPVDWIKKLSKSKSDINKKRVESVKNRLKKKNVSYRDAAAVNIMRLELQKRLLPTEFGSGGRTKYNRTKLGLKKEHWIDAACIGNSGEQVAIANINRYSIKAMGHGSRQFCRMNQFGFPRTKAKPRIPFVHGFQTGDMVKAIVTNGKKTGCHIGRIAVRSSGYFNLLSTKMITGVSWKSMTKLMNNDGYEYHIDPA
jgi:5-methylcytosine-specific restriction endonuclease McrA